MSATAVPAPRKLFVTTALPYANGPFHIGHIMEYIQADIWVRFQRMRGPEVNFGCADDAHALRGDYRKDFEILQVADAPQSVFEALLFGR